MLPDRYYRFLNNHGTAAGWANTPQPDPTFFAGAITTLALICSVVPPSEISNVYLFTGKLVVGTSGVIGSAWVLYSRGKRFSNKIRLNRRNPAETKIPAVSC